MGCESCRLAAQSFFRCSSPSFRMTRRDNRECRTERRECRFRSETAPPSLHRYVTGARIHPIDRPAAAATTPEGKKNPSLRPRCGAWCSVQSNPCNAGFRAPVCLVKSPRKTGPDPISVATCSCHSGVSACRFPINMLSTGIAMPR